MKKISYKTLPAAFALGLLMSMPVVARAQDNTQTTTPSGGAFQSQTSTGTAEGDVHKSSSTWDNLKKKIKGNKNNEDTETKTKKSDNGSSKDSTY